MHGDAASEAFLSEIVGAVPWPGQRHWNMESIYEYGARAGFWRLHRMFTKAGIPITVYGVATALARAPEPVAAMQEAGWEIASHGLKWVEYKDISREQEEADLKEAIRIHTAVTGEPPRGWYLGRCSINTVELVAAQGGFAYISDAYNDDLPYWLEQDQGNQLIIPYTLDTNDMRFATAQGFNSGSQFFDYLKDTFDTLYAEGQEGQSKMMNIGLHCRLTGRPGRAAALQRFIDYIRRHEKVWYARRIDIARHWYIYHPPLPQVMDVYTMDRHTFVQTFGQVFGSNPWIAERTYDHELSPALRSLEGLYRALVFQFRTAAPAEREAVLRVPPDRGKKSTASASVDAVKSACGWFSSLMDKERIDFAEIHTMYREKFGYPLILAAQEGDKEVILDNCTKRLKNSPDEEFPIACAEVEKIAHLRLQEIFTTAI